MSNDNDNERPEILEEAQLMENMRREQNRIAEFFQRLEAQQRDEQQQREYQRVQSLMTDTQREDYSKRLDAQREELAKLTETIQRENQRLDKIKEETLRNEEAAKRYGDVARTRKIVAEGIEKAPAPEQGVDNYKFDADGLNHQRQKQQQFTPMDQPIGSEQERHFWETHRYDIKTGGFERKTYKAMDETGYEYDKKMDYDPYKYGPMNQGEYDKRMVIHLKEHPNAPGVDAPGAPGASSQDPSTPENPEDHPGRKLRKLYEDKGLIKPEGDKPAPGKPGKSGKGDDEEKKPEVPEQETPEKKKKPLPN